MNRKSFLGGLVALIAAPKGIALAMTEKKAASIIYSYTEVKTVAKYIEGYAKMSKQLMANLPFLQETLPKILLRDFKKSEYESLL